MSAKAIKTCLMDQRAVVGIGNVYSDEILHRIRLYPGTPARALRPDDWAILGQIVPRTLQKRSKPEESAPPWIRMHDDWPVSPKSFVSTIARENLVGLAAL